MSLSTSMQRLNATPPRNVGGGDLATRVFVIIGLLLLMGMTVPQSLVPHSVLKICLLTAAELGLVCLMLGLFLRSKTYFAGLQLVLASFSMLWLNARDLPWGAILAGAVFMTVGLITVVTRRSRLNAALNLSSLRVPLEEIEDAAAADASATAAAVDPKAAPLTAAGAQ